MGSPQPSPRLLNHERLFADRYPLLVRWANQVTGGDKALADDLVHDSYVQFVFARPDLTRIESLDRYLYGMLRNLYVSHLRRGSRMPENALSVVDYDSAEISLKYADERERQRVRDEVWQACEYVCARKEISRSGSIMILRFFHGYYPAEIALITGNSKAAVSENLRAARDEVHEYLRRPRRLARMRNTAVRPIPRPADGIGTCAFQEALRNAVFLSCSGPCIPPRMLRKIYDGASTEPIPKTILAHLVSCAVCLETVNVTLNLPPLSERDPMDMTGRDDNDTSNQPPGGQHGDDLERAIQRGRRGARQTFEHRPRQLYVAVNGRHLASHSLHAGTNEASFQIEHGKEIEFVEIFSEQGIRLIFLPVDAGSDSISQEIELSEGRSLFACLRLSGPSPLLQVTYRYPVPGELRLIEKSIEARLGPDPLLPPSVGFLRRLGALWPGNHGILRWASVFALVMSAVMLSLWRFSSEPNAMSVLQQASAAERASCADRVLHRSIRIQEITAEGTSPSTTVEVFQSSKLGRASKLVYDAHRQLIAGEWTAPDGLRTILQRKQARRDTHVSFEDNPTSAEAWRFDLSAEAFLRLLRSSQQADITADGDFYTVSYRQGLNARSDGLVNADLKLTRNNLCATKAILGIRNGGEIRQFIFTEFSREQRDLTRVDPSVFLPSTGPQFTRIHPKTIRNKAELHTMSPAFEIAVLYALAGLNADMGEGLTVHRLPDGRIKVAGLVADESRRTEILRALPRTSVAELRTVGEALQKRPGGGERAEPALVQRLQLASTSILVDAEIRHELQNAGIPTGKLDEAVRAFSREMVNTSWATMQHVRALQATALRFTADELAEAPELAKAQWTAIIFRHAAATHDNLMLLNARLRSVSLVVWTPPTPIGEIRDVRELKAAADRLVRAWSDGEHTLAAAFSLSLGDESESTLDMPALPRQLSEALALSSEIKTAAARLDRCFPLKQEY